MLKEGQKAPAFKLDGNDGKTHTLKDFAGAPLVIYFYPKDNTPGCTTEACDFSDGLTKFRKLGAGVVGVSPDSIKSHDGFAAKHGLKHLLLSDPDKAMAGAYGVFREKTLYGRKFMGIVRTTFVVDGKGVIRRIFDKVKVNGHVEEVLDAVKEL